MTKVDSRSPNDPNNFMYSARDRLVQVKKGLPGSEEILGQYDYNHEGNRIRHRHSDRGDVDYYYDDGAVIEERNAADDSLLAYYQYADRLIALAQPSGTQYYHHDALGSTIGLTDQTGADKKSYHLDPWGNIRWETGTSDNRKVFTGKEHDKKTGLVYFGARYYDPEIGRFITQDTYLGEQNQPPSLHRYLYAYSNPTAYIDLQGYSSMEVDETTQRAEKEEQRVAQSWPDGAGEHLATPPQPAAAAAKKIIETVKKDRITKEEKKGSSEPTIGSIKADDTVYKAAAFAMWRSDVPNPMGRPDDPDIWVGEGSAKVFKTKDELRQDVMSNPKLFERYQAYMGWVNEGYDIDILLHEGKYLKWATKKILRRASDPRAPDMPIAAPLKVVKGKRVLEGLQKSTGKLKPRTKARPSTSARLPPKGTEARLKIERARRQGIRAKKAQELADIRAGGSGSGVWTESELEQIRKTGRFPSDVRWHHDPSVANRPDLAADPNVVQPVRGGTPGHLEAHGGDWRKP